MALSRRARSLKRWFVLPYFGGNLLALIHSLVRVGLGEDVAGWAIAAGAHAAVLAFAPRSWPRRESGLGSLLALTGAAGVALAALLPSTLAPLLQVVLLAVVGSVLYVGWYARFGRAPAAALTPGALLPGLRLQSVDGSSWSLEELRGAPAALFFFRGAWCPFCSAQVRAVARGYGLLAERGVRVAMISPQPLRETRKLAERFGVEVLWLRDPDLRAAKALGIVDAGGVPAGARGFGVDTVLPTLVVLDAGGRVIAAEETDNYRVRPDPETVLAILDSPPPPVTPRSPARAYRSPARSTPSAAARRSGSGR